MSDPSYCLLWVDWWPVCMTKQEWAAWVQAIGTVAAVIAGAAAIYWQVRTQRQHVRADRVAAETELVTTTAEILRSAQASIRVAQSALNEVDGRTTYVGSTSLDVARVLNNLVEVLESTAPAAFPTMRLRLEYVVAKDAIRQLARQVACLDQLDPCGAQLAVVDLVTARRSAGQAFGLVGLAAKAFEQHRPM